MNRVVWFLLSVRRPPRSTRTYTLVPDTTHVRSVASGSLQPVGSAKHNAACDQVGWVMYLIAELIRLVPSTSSTSPLRKVAASASGLLVGPAGAALAGAERKRASQRPSQRLGVIMPCPRVYATTPWMIQPVPAWPAHVQPTRRPRTNRRPPTHQCRTPLTAQNRPTACATIQTSSRRRGRPRCRSQPWPCSAPRD